MNTIQNLFQQAQLAEAAYADLTTTIGSQSNLLTALNVANKDQYGGSFTLAQATDFVAHWRVVSHQPNTTSGFSATVFESLDHPGQYEFAVRGSENLFSASGAVDWLAADTSDIGGQGIALRQAIDLYNYIQSLKIPQGATYQAAYLKTAQFESVELTTLWLASKVSVLALPAYEAYKSQLESAGYWVNGGTVSTLALGNSDQVLTGDLALGKQPAGLTASTSFDVLGHSLGGHLAMVMQRLDAPNVASVETFNPPFFDPSTSNQISDRFFSQLRQAEIAAYGSSNIATSFNPALYQHYVVGGDVVHNIGSVQPGAQTEITIFTESQDTNAVSAHKINYITDSLAVYNLFATLDTAFSNATPDNINSITNFIKASSNVAANSLEFTLDALRTLLQTDYTLGSANRFALPATVIDDRESLYANLQSLQTYLAASSFNLGTTQQPQYAFALRTLTEAAGTVGLADAAKTDMAIRYALYQGNTFIIDATRYSTDLYGTINSNGALDLYDPVTHTGNLTDAYLKDRAAFLLAKQKANTDDKHILDIGDNRGQTTVFRFSTPKDAINYAAARFVCADTFQHFFRSLAKQIACKAALNVALGRIAFETLVKSGK